MEHQDQVEQEILLQQVPLKDNLAVEQDLVEIIFVEEVVVGPFGNGKWRRGGAMSD